MRQCLLGQVCVGQGRCHSKVLGTEMKGLLGQVCVGQGRMS